MRINGSFLLSIPVVKHFCSNIFEAPSKRSFTDLDFAEDVSILAELLELLVPVLETMASEAASLGLEMNWQKTMVQALGCRVCHSPSRFRARTSW